MSHDLEPGELPICQSPFLPTSDGEGIIREVYFFDVYLGMLRSSIEMNFSHKPTLLALSRRGFLYITVGGKK